MTPRAIERQAAVHLRRWVALLALAEWDIGLAIMPGDTLDGDRVTAQVVTDTDTRQATICLATGSCTPARLASDIAHECLHIVLADLDAAGRVAAGQLGAEARAIAESSIGTANERATYRLERALRKLAAIP